jgi:hypothetical protein
MPTTTTRKARTTTTTRARREESTMAPTTFPRFRETTRAEKPLAKLAATYDAGALRVTFTAEEDATIATAYADGGADAATCYSDSEAAELLTYTVASQAAAMYCDCVRDEDSTFGGMGLSRVALALVCWRWAEGWVAGIKAIHADATGGAK